MFQRTGFDTGRREKNQILIPRVFFRRWLRSVRSLFYSSEDVAEYQVAGIKIDYDRITAYEISFLPWQVDNSPQGRRKREIAPQLHIRGILTFCVSSFFFFSFLFFHRRAFLRSFLRSFSSLSQTMWKLDARY